MAPLREALAARERRVGEVEQQLGETVQRCQWLEHRDNAAAGQIAELQETLDRERKANLGFKELLQIAETRLAEVFHNLSVEALNRTNAAFFNLGRAKSTSTRTGRPPGTSEAAGRDGGVGRPPPANTGRIRSQDRATRRPPATTRRPPARRTRKGGGDPAEPIAFGVPAHEAASSTEFGIEKLAGDAREISDMGQKMHDQLLDIRSHIAYLGKFLDGARDVYRETVGPSGHGHSKGPEDVEARPAESVPPPEAPAGTGEPDPPKPAEKESAPAAAKPESVPDPPAEAAPEPESKAAGKAEKPAAAADAGKTRPPEKPARPAARIAKKAPRRKRPAARRKKPVKPAARSRAKVEEDDAEDGPDGLVLDFDRETGMHGNGSRSPSRLRGGVEAD